MRTRGPLAAFAAFGVFWGSWGALLPDIKAATGASEPELGLALLAIAGGALPAMLGTGLLLDRSALAPSPPSSPSSPEPLSCRRSRTR